jgi:hypothetical protein
MTKKPFAIVTVVGLGIVGCYRPDPVAPPGASSVPHPGGSAVALRPEVPSATATPSAAASASGIGSGAGSTAAGNGMSAAGVGASTPTATGTKPVPTTTSSARVPYERDRFTPPDRGLPPEMKQVNTPRASRSPRAAASGTKFARSSVLAAPESAGGVAGISFDDLVFEISPGQEFDASQFNDGVRSLFERNVKIRGYILPSSVLFDKGNTNFILVRDNLDCCFGPGAALYDCIRVNMKPGRTADFRAIPVAVSGTLQFRQYRDFEGVTTSVFALEADSVE